MPRTVAASGLVRCPQATERKASPDSWAARPLLTGGAPRENGAAPPVEMRRAPKPGVILAVCRHRTDGVQALAVVQIWDQHGNFSGSGYHTAIARLELADCLEPPTSHRRCAKFLDGIEDESIIGRSCETLQ